MSTTMRRRPVTPKTDALARRHAFWQIEHSTEPLAVVASENREQARLATADHQYKWAGFYRRMAEIQEDFAGRLGIVEESQ